MDSLVYQITKLARTPGERDLIVALTSKRSAQNMLANIAERESINRYRLTAFRHAELPGLER